MDAINIEILPDGTIKMTTDRISGANHLSAEGFIRECVTLAGGKTKATRKGTAHAHTHAEKHQHAGGEEPHDH